MKKLVAFLNIVLFSVSIVLFLFLDVIAIGDKSFSGIQYLFGYSEKTNLLFTEVTSVYFKGYPIIGIVMIACALLGILCSIIALVSKKKMARIAFALTMLVAVGPVAYTFFIPNSAEVFSNYGNASLSLIALGSEVGYGVGAYLFFSLNALALVLSFISICDSK